MLVFLNILEKKKDRNKSAHSQDVTEEKTEKEPVNKGEWLTTMPSGERFLTRLDGTQLPVKDALVCIASDPMTKQVTTEGSFILKRKRKPHRFQPAALFPICVFILQRQQRQQKDQRKNWFLLSLSL